MGAGNRSEDFEYTIPSTLQYIFTTCLLKDLQAFYFFVGYECEPYNNPADFFLDVINGDSTAVASNKTGEIEIGMQNTVSCVVCCMKRCILH